MAKFLIFDLGFKFLKKFLQTQEWVFAFFFVLKKRNSDKHVTEMKSSCFITVNVLVNEEERKAIM